MPHYIPRFCPCPPSHAETRLTKAFLVFDTANCTHPSTLLERPSARSHFSNRLFLPFSDSLSSRNKSRVYRVREYLREEKKEEERVVARKVAAAIRSRFNELSPGGRGARNPFGRESACVLEERIIALCHLLAAKGEKDSGHARLCKTYRGDMQPGAPLVLVCA